MRIARVELSAPLLCLALLGGVSLERAHRLSPMDVEPYHARAKSAVDSVRYTLTGDEVWTGTDVPVPEAAQQLLRPNALLSRVYIGGGVDRGDTASARRAGERVSLLVVQCRDPRDMQGHYPPNCYPAHGSTLAARREMSFEVPVSAGNVPKAAPTKITVRATEYRFANGLAGGGGGPETGVIVLNILVLPGVGTTPDMSGVYRTSEDYQRRLYGAAQLQIVVPDSMPEARRQKIYETFLAASGPMLAQLLETTLSPAADTAGRAQRADRFATPPRRGDL